MRDLGVLMLQMVTGREKVGGESGGGGGGGALVGEADERAGEWPVEVAVRFGMVGGRCAQVSGREEVGIVVVLMEMEELKKMAMAWREQWGDGGGNREEETDGYDVPGVFVCPILQVLSLSLSLKIGSGQTQTRKSLPNGTPEK